MGNAPKMGTRGLPRGPSTLVGRDHDLAQVAEMLGDARRLVTLFGPAGVGKTRLAMEIAERVSSDGGRVVVARLAEVAGPEQALAAFSSALGVTPMGGGAVDEVLRETARELVAEGPVLLVLDDFDRLVEHASALLDPLLAGGGTGLRLLVTSREILRHEAEQAHELLPLELPRPDASDAMVSPALRLFVERVRRYRRTFPDSEAEMVDAIDLVRRLDGMPLPLELVAPRVALLGAASVRDALKDVLVTPNARRVSTDRASVHRALESSWALLTPEERHAIAQCSVFRGSFTVDAVEEIIDRPPGYGGVLDFLQALREKSLLARTEASPDGTPRFRFYATVRDYTAEKLAELGEEIASDVEVRHANHYLALAEQWAEATDGFEGAAMLRALSTERENLEAVVERALASTGAAAAERALRGALTLAILAFARGPLVPLTRWLDAALTRFADTPVEPRLRAEALTTRGRARRRGGRPEESEADQRAAIALASEAGNRSLEARVRLELTLGKFGRGRVDDAFAEWATTCDLARDAGDAKTEGIALTRGAVVLRERGYLPAALEAANRALELHRTIGNANFEALALGELAVLAIEEDDLAKASQLVERAHYTVRASGNSTSEAFVSGQRAMVRFVHADLDGTIEDYERAARLLHQVDYPRFEAGARAYIGVVHLERGELERADEMLGAALSLVPMPSDARWMTLFTAYKAVGRARAGEHARASELLAEAPALSETDTFRGVVDVLREIVAVVERGEVSDRARELASQRPASFDLRIAVRLLRRVLSEMGARSVRPAALPVGASSSTLRAHVSGAWFELPDRPRVDTTSRKALPPLLKRLVEERVARPGRFVTIEELVRVAWPEQRVVSAAAKNRLRVALTQLRGLGLRDRLVSARGGYALDPTESIDVVDA